MNDEMNEKMTDRADRAVSRQVPAAKPVLDSLYVQALVLPVGGGPSSAFPSFTSSQHNRWNSSEWKCHWRWAALSFFAPGAWPPL